MRINNMIRENQKTIDYTKYILIAVAVAFLFALFLNISYQLLSFMGGLVVNYWTWFLGGLLVLLILRKLTKKKVIKHEYPDYQV